MYPNQQNQGGYPPQQQQQHDQYYSHNQGGYPPQGRGPPGPRGPPPPQQYQSNAGGGYGGPPPPHYQGHPNPQWRGPPPRGPPQMHGRGPPPSHYQGPPNQGPPPYQGGPPPHQGHPQQNYGPQHPPQHPPQQQYGGYQQSYDRGPPPQEDWNHQAPAQTQSQQDYDYGGAAQPTQQQPQQPSAQQNEPAAPAKPAQRGAFEPELSDADVNLKFDKLQDLTASVRNLEILMNKQLETTKQLASSNQSFKETTRSIFGQSHHYYSESCRIVDVHQTVGQMYHNYISSMEQTVEQVRTWATKFRVVTDRKQMRERALTDFNKAHIAFEKKCTNNSQAPKHLEERKKAEHSARLAFSHLEQQNRQLYDLMEDLMRDRHDTLNLIVGEYMTKSHMFHKKANQTFQTLSSMDAEGHKVAEMMQQAEGKGDRQYHRMKVLDQFNTMSPAEQQQAVYKDPVQPHHQDEQQQPEPQPQPQYDDYNQQPSSQDNQQYQSQYQPQSYDDQNQGYYDQQYQQTQNYGNSNNQGYDDPNLQYYSQSAYDQHQQPYQTHQQYQQDPHQSYNQGPYNDGSRMDQSYKEPVTNTNPLDTVFGSSVSGAQSHYDPNPGYDKFGRPIPQRNSDIKGGPGPGQSTGSQFDKYGRHIGGGQAQEENKSSQGFDHLPSDPHWTNYGQQQPQPQPRVSDPFASFAGANNQGNKMPQPGQQQAPGNDIFDLLGGPGSKAPQQQQQEVSHSLNNIFGDASSSPGLPRQQSQPQQNNQQFDFSIGVQPTQQQRPPQNQGYNNQGPPLQQNYSQQSQPQYQQRHPPAQQAQPTSNADPFAQLGEQFNQMSMQTAPQNPHQHLANQNQLNMQQQPAYNTNQQPQQQQQQQNQGQLPGRNPFEF